MNFSMYANFYKSVQAHGIDAAADQAVSLGFSSVEFFDFVSPTWVKTVPDRETAEQMRRALEARSLSVACYSVAVNLYEEGMTPDTVTEAERALMHYAEMSAALGSPYLHQTLLLGLPRLPNLSIEDALDAILPAVVRVARYARSLGVTCIYEDQGEYFNGVEGFGTFFRAIKRECPWVGVCGDVGNVLFVDESPVEFFRTYAKDMLHVHIKDYIKAETPDGTDGWAVSLGGTYLKNWIIGEGCVNVRACLEILRDVGYRGAIALENGHEPDFSEGCRIAMQLCKDTLSE